MNKLKQDYYPTKEEYNTLLNQYNEFGGDPDYISSRVFDLEIKIIKLKNHITKLEKVTNEILSIFKEHNSGH